MVKAVTPGMSPRELGLRWAELERERAYFDGGKPDSGNAGHGFGHGLATSFPGYVLPIGDAEIGPFGYRRLQETLRPGMVLAAEAFLSRPGVGTAGIENNFIVTASGAELLDRNPMLYW